jgi:hypothetical protein
MRRMFRSQLLGLGPTVNHGYTSATRRTGLIPSERE